MFCTKCGSQLEDGAKFCTNCGAQTRFAQVPAPAAPEPQQPAQPQQPQQWQQPAQPQQPQQRQQQWQQQQPQQWQQIQQQWQQQQATRQQPAPQQWQQPQTRAAAPVQPAKKKGKGGLIAGIIAAVLVVAVGVGGFVWPGFFKRGKDGSAGIGGGGAISTAIAEKFSTPEEFYQTVETSNVDSLTGHVTSAYDAILLSNVTADDLGVTGTVRLEIGDKLRELLLDALGDSLEEMNPGEDLKWMKTLALAYEFNHKDDLSGVNASIQLNGTDIAHLKAIVHSADGTVWLSVPELTDRWLQTTLEELNLDDLSDLTSSSELRSVLSLFTSENAEKLDPIKAALPDEKTVGSLLDKYLTEAVDCIEDVEKETGTLSTEDVSAEYTVLTSTITPETVVKIVEKLGPELKADKDIKTIILDMAEAAGEEGETKYKEFTDRIDELLGDTSKITEEMKNNVVMTVYLDKSGDVHGRVIDAGNQRIELLMPEKGGQFGLTIRYTKEGEELLLLSGSGKRSGDKLTGDLDLTVKGEYYAQIGLDGFDVEKVKDGYFSGGVELRPTASLWDQIDKPDDDGERRLPESVRSLLESLVLRFDLNTAKDKAEITLTVSNGSEKFFSLALDGAKTGAKKLSPADGVGTSEWSEDITLDNLEKVVASIEKAGVPTAYTEMLDEALESSF